MKHFTNILAGLLFLMIIPGIFAQTGGENAIIRDLTGIVEIKRAGSPDWQTAARGQNLSLDTTIVFPSSATFSVLLAIRSACIGRHCEYTLE